MKYKYFVPKNRPYSCTCALTILTTTSAVDAVSTSRIPELPERMVKAYNE